MKSCTLCIRCTGITHESYTIDSKYTSKVQETYLENTLNLHTTSFGMCIARDQWLTSDQRQRLHGSGLAECRSCLCLAENATHSWLANASNSIEHDHRTALKRFASVHCTAIINNC